MLYILTGPDQFSKKEFITALSLKHKAPLETIFDALPEISYFSQTTLFGEQKVFLLKNLLVKLDLDRDVELLKQSPHEIILEEESLDKRKKTTSKLLADKQITVKEFTAPQGPALFSWLETRAKQYGTSFQKPAAKLFLELLVAETGPSGYGPSEANLWQLDNELQKLASYTGNHPITETAVGELISSSVETGVFEIINAAAERRAEDTGNLLENFLKNGDGTDEKSKIIQFNAILSDQLRNLLLFKYFEQQRTPDTEILKRTAWKSGRLYIMKRLAQKFSAQKLQSLLSKLESLDGELKTSSTPPRVLLDLIMTQMLV